MISIERHTEDQVSTISKLTFKANNGEIVDSLYKAILINYEYPSEQTIALFAKNLFFKSLTYQEDKYWTFIVWDEESLERAILVLAYEFYLDGVWKQTGTYGHCTLLSFYNDALHNISKHIANSTIDQGMSLYFHMDDRGDSPNYEWGLTEVLLLSIDTDIRNLEAARNVARASLNEARWDASALKQANAEFKGTVGGANGTKEEKKAIDTATDALDNILGTYASGTFEPSRTDTEVPPTPVSSNSNSEEETKEPTEEAPEKEEVVDLWHWERDTDAVTAINACNRVCRGFPLQPRVTTVTFKCSDTQEPLMQVMSGIEFVPIDASISADMRMYEGMWLARGVDEDVDGSRYDTLQIVADTKEGRVVFQQYRVKL